MKPTDEQLNRAAAEVCGWRERQDFGYRNSDDSFVMCWLHPDDDEDEYAETYLAPPGYCKDRNALPELLDKVDSDGDIAAFSHELRYLCAASLTERYSKSRTFAVASAPPRLHVIAALKALGKWQDDWEE